ncbi:MAG: mannose-1-phosphate guanylyltransferase [Lachnospiraceae bacterium]|nr:mannose-1-phosphate guanylyltransferase [Lachnospiraceae bacterium]
MKRYGVIMAGGNGSRFWPLGRKERPKQLLNLSGKDLMINETLKRLSFCIEKENLMIVTNVSQASLMEEETKEWVKKENILSEPAARNTAACIGYAAMEILRKHGDGIMCILPSDQFVKDEEEFVRVMEAAIVTAEETDGLVTIGICPTFPATGYGYIKSKEGSRTPIGDKNMKNYSIVEEFVEKPDKETAQIYLEKGGYLWNSGMFVWKASTILSYMERLLPDVYSCLQEIGKDMGTDREQETIERVYPAIPKISIDYGIMERADHVLVIPAEFGWNDIGSLDMLTLMKEADEKGNVSYGETVFEDCEGSILYAADKLVAAVGMKDVIVVQTKDAVLVCPKDKAQDVKKLTERLEATGKERYL